MLILLLDSSLEVPAISQQNSKLLLGHSVVGRSLNHSSVTYQHYPGRFTSLDPPLPDL